MEPITSKEIEKFITDTKRLADQQITMKRIRDNTMRSDHIDRAAEEHHEHPYYRAPNSLWVKSTQKIKDGLVKCYKAFIDIFKSPKYYN